MEREELLERLQNVSEAISLTAEEKVLLRAIASRTTGRGPAAISPDDDTKALLSLFKKKALFLFARPTISGNAAAR